MVFAYFRSQCRGVLRRASTVIGRLDSKPVSVRRARGLAQPKRSTVIGALGLALLSLEALLLPAQLFAFEVALDSSGLGYTNCRVRDVPWSIHVVQVARSNGLYELHSVHAGMGAVGLDTLSDQIMLLNPAWGKPVAAINGDFYQRDRAYAGAPRGLQVIDSELISGPNSKISFWTDVIGEA